MLIAEEAGQPVGFMLATMAPMVAYGGGIGFVQELYVDEAARRSGAGTALLAAFAAIASEAGVTVIALTTSRAGAFYTSLGFTPGAEYYSIDAAELLALPLNSLDNGGLVSQIESACRMGAQVPTPLCSQVPRPGAVDLVAQGQQRLRDPPGHSSSSRVK